MRSRVGVLTSPPKVVGNPGPASSIRTMRMFGAPSRRRRSAGCGLYTDSCMVRLAILPDGLGGNGSTSCATLALGAATIRQDRLTANSSAFIARNIAAHSIVVFVLAVMCVLPALCVSPVLDQKGDLTEFVKARSNTKPHLSGLM